MEMWRIIRVRDGLMLQNKPGEEKDSVVVKATKTCSD